MTRTRINFTGNQRGLISKHAILPLLAIVGLLFAIRTVVQGSVPQPVAAPLVEPARAPFPNFVAGAGIIEPSSESISVSSAVSGVVSAIHVKVGDVVEVDAPLFTVDDREAKSALMVAKAAVSVAEAELGDAKNRLAMRQSVVDKRAVSLEDITGQRFAVQVAEAKLGQAQAQAKSKETDLERLTVRSPIDGEVLQIRLRPGEFAPAQTSLNPLMIVGAVTELRVRVDVDENDAWRVKPNARAAAFLRGNKEISTEIEFVRFEPFVVPKRSLTGESTERVDTRVLQVLYRFDPAKLRVFVGQLMDVFIESETAKSAD